MKHGMSVGWSGGDKGAHRRLPPAASYRFPAHFPKGDAAGRPTNCRERCGSGGSCLACGAAGAEPCRRAADAAAQSLNREPEVA